MTPTTIATNGHDPAVSHETTVTLATTTATRCLSPGCPSTDYTLDVDGAVPWVVFFPCAHSHPAAKFPHIVPPAPRQGDIRRAPLGTVLGICADDDCDRDATRRFRGAVYCPSHDPMVRHVAVEVVDALELDDEVLEPVD